MVIRSRAEYIKCYVLGRFRDLYRLKRDIPSNARYSAPHPYLGWWYSPRFMETWG